MRFPRLLLALSLVLLLGTAQAAQSAPAAPTPLSIQALINAAQDGGTVTIPPGEYTESLTINKNLNLEGTGRATTVLHALANQSIVAITLSPANTVRLRHLTISGARVPNGGTGGVSLSMGAPSSSRTA